MTAVCESCNHTFLKLKDNISRLKSELSQKDKLVMEFSTIATAQAKRIAILTTSELHAMSYIPSDNDTTIPWPQSIANGAPGANPDRSSSHGAPERADLGHSSENDTPEATHGQYENPWSLQGGRPKLQTTSTPRQKIVNGWTEIMARRGQNSKAKQHPRKPQGVQLENRFNALDLQEYPSLPPPSVDRRSRTATAPPPPPREIHRDSGHTGQTSLHAQEATTQEKATPQRQGAKHHQDAAGKAAAVHSPAPPQIQIGQPGSAAAADNRVTSLVIGDSIIRKVKIRNARTLCFPGADVLTIADKIPGIIKSYPKTQRILLHVGTNDVSKRASQLLKGDFAHLLDILISLRCKLFISGPIPTYGRGSESFSRLLSLNDWLSSACGALGVHFIDNFNVFWEQGNLFARDGLHLNNTGAQLLSDHLVYEIDSLRTPHTSTHLSHSQLNSSLYSLLSETGSDHGSVK